MSVSEDRGQRRVTSADVAREAGTSRATVSYVLNDTPHQKIPTATRERVLAAAARLGYAPSAAARSLRSGRSDVVLWLLPDWPLGPAVGEMMQGLSHHLAAAGYTFVLHPSTAADRPLSSLWRSLTPAAVLSFSELTRDDVAAMRAAGVAVVVELVGGENSPPDLEVPQERVGRLQVEHLASRGHSRIGYAYPEDDRVRSFAEPRLTGAAIAAAELGLPPLADATVPLDVAAAADAVRSWVGSGVTAVCAYNDEVALAVLAGARRAGVLVPSELAVVGVDDIPSARLADPPLTTVTLDGDTLARHLAASVVAAASGSPAPSPPTLDLVLLLPRAST